MRNPVSAFRYPTLRVAAVAALAGMAASCSNATRFQEPLFTSSTANQKEIIGAAADQPMPAPVSRAELPPPPTAVAAGLASLHSGAPAAPAAPDEDGYAWTAVGGAVITVGPGETLDTIAIKYGVPPSRILTANQLTSAAEVGPGRVLVIPHRVGVASGISAKAPVILDQEDGPRPATNPAAATYLVRSGDTLYSIGRQYGVGIDDLLSLNGISSNRIFVGQSLRLPAGAKPGSQAVASADADQPKPPARDAAAAHPKVALSSPAAPSIPVQATPAPTAVAAAAAIEETAAPSSADGTSFRWPVRGRIISGFGAKPNGERNDGINLAVPEGTSVKAVEAGTVIYAGNELEGYGNLVLVRHADGWVSAYAHNKDLLVERGDTIRRGQVVAHAGMTGSVSAPQVHFELRKGAKPVNPLDYLTG